MRKATLPYTCKTTCSYILRCCLENHPTCMFGSRIARAIRAKEWWSCPKQAWPFFNWCVRDRQFLRHRNSVSFPTSTRAAKTARSFGCCDHEKLYQNETKDLGPGWFFVASLCHRENGGTLVIVPLIINPIYTLYSGPVFLGYIPLFQGSFVV